MTIIGSSQASNNAVQASQTQQLTVSTISGPSQLSTEESAAYLLGTAIAAADATQNPVLLADPRQPDGPQYTVNELAEKLDEEYGTTLLATYSAGVGVNGYDVHELNSVLSSINTQTRGFDKLEMLDTSVVQAAQAPENPALVSRGDTLESMAERLGTTPNNLALFNGFGLNADTASQALLRPGMVLRSEAPEHWLVGSANGADLPTLIASSNLSEQQFLSLNGLDSLEQVGEQTQFVWSKSQSDTVSLSANPSGLTLTQVAEAFGVDRSALATYNGANTALENAVIPPFFVTDPSPWEGNVRLPVSQTFAQAAERYGVPVTTLTTLNPEIEAEPIVAGTQIQLSDGNVDLDFPSLFTASQDTTWTALGREFGIDPTKLREWNSDATNILNSGSDEQVAAGTPIRYLADPALYSNDFKRSALEAIDRAFAPIMAEAQASGSVTDALEQSAQDLRASLAALGSPSAQAQYRAELNQEISFRESLDAIFDSQGGTPTSASELTRPDGTWNTDNWMGRLGQKLADEGPRFLQELRNNGVDPVEDLGLPQNLVDFAGPNPATTGIYASENGHRVLFHQLNGIEFESGRGDGWTADIGHNFFTGAYHVTGLTEGNARSRYTGEVRPGFSHNGEFFHATSSYGGNRHEPQVAWDPNSLYLTNGVLTQAGNGFRAEQYQAQYGYIAVREGVYSQTWNRNGWVDVGNNPTGSGSATTNLIQIRSNLDAMIEVRENRLSAFEQRIQASQDPHILAGVFGGRSLGPTAEIMIADLAYAAPGQVAEADQAKAREVLDNRLLSINLTHVANAAVDGQIDVNAPINLDWSSPHYRDFTPEQRTVGGFLAATAVTGPEGETDYLSILGIASWEQTASNGQISLEQAQQFIAQANQNADQLSRELTVVGARQVTASLDVQVIGLATEQLQNADSLNSFARDLRIVAAQAGPDRLVRGSDSIPALGMTASEALAQTQIDGFDIDAFAQRQGILSSSFASALEPGKELGAGQLLAWATDIENQADQLTAQSNEIQGASSEGQAWRAFAHRLEVISQEGMWGDAIGWNARLESIVGAEPVQVHHIISPARFESSQSQFGVDFEARLEELGALPDGGFAAYFLEREHRGAVSPEEFAQLLEAVRNEAARIDVPLVPASVNETVSETESTTESVGPIDAIAATPDNISVNEDGQFLIDGQPSDPLTVATSIRLGNISDTSETLESLLQEVNERVEKATFGQDLIELIEKYESKMADQGVTALASLSNEAQSDLAREFQNEMEQLALANGVSSPVDSFAPNVRPSDPAGGYTAEDLQQIRNLTEAFVDTATKDNERDQLNIQQQNGYLQQMIENLNAIVKAMTQAQADLARRL